MPGETWEDPHCVEAIKIARENIGDLKLKSDGDYVVPKHLRMNAQQKRAQLVGLETKVRANSLLHTPNTLWAFAGKIIFIIQELTTTIRTVVTQLKCIMQAFNQWNLKVETFYIVINRNCDIFNSVTVSHLRHFEKL